MVVENPFMERLRCGVTTSRCGLTALWGDYGPSNTPVRYPCGLLSVSVRRCRYRAVSKKTVQEPRRFYTVESVPVNRHENRRIL